MKVTALNEQQRKKIVKSVRPKRDDLYSYQNLNLLTAVCDENKIIYLTEIYYLSAAIQRTDEQYGTHKYVLLTPIGCFQVKCKEDAGNNIVYSTPLPILLPKGTVSEMIQYYQNSFSERFQLKKHLISDSDFRGMDFTEWYLTHYYW